MSEPLSSLSITDFLDRLGSRAPTPGGGSASALAGATAASLLAMVVEVSAGRSEAASAAMEEQLAAAHRLRSHLTELVDSDAAAYDAVVAARRLPRSTEEETTTRGAQLADATREATRIPLRIAARACEVLALAEQVAAYGARSAISDVGVAGELGAAAVRGAALNVRINLPFLAADDPVALEASAEIERILADASALEAAVRAGTEGA